MWTDFMRWIVRLCGLAILLMASLMAVYMAPELSGGETVYMILILALLSVLGVEIIVKSFVRENTRPDAVASLPQTWTRPSSSPELCDLCCTQAAENVCRTHGLSLCNPCTQRHDGKACVLVPLYARGVACQ